MESKVRLKSRQDLHLPRKIWHMLGVLSMAGLYFRFGPTLSGYILAGACAIMIPLDLMRQKIPSLNALTLKIFGPVMRAHESNRLTGLTYLFVGCAVMFLLFRHNSHIVILTLLFHAFGDPIASYFGIKFGKDRIFRKKTLQGTMAAFIACTIISSIYYYWHNLMSERLAIVAPLSGFIGAGAELFPFGRFDDNLVFPIVCSCSLWVLFQVYGGFV